MARETRLSMTPEEARKFLASKSVLFLATLADDQTPVGDVARYVMIGDWLYFLLPKDGASYRNLLRDSRVACSAEQNPSYLEIAAVVVHGRAEPVTDPDRSGAVTAALMSAGAAVPTGARDYLTTESVLFRVPVGDDVMSFDFSKIEDKSRAVDH